MPKVSTTQRYLACQLLLLALPLRMFFVLITALVTRAEEARVTAAMEDRRMAQAAAQAQKSPSNAGDAGIAGTSSSGGPEAASGSSHGPVAHKAAPAPAYEAGGAGEPINTQPAVRRISAPVHWTMVGKFIALIDQLLLALCRSQGRPSMWVPFSSVPLTMLRMLKAPHTKARAAHLPQLQKHLNSSLHVSECAMS